MVTRLGKDHPLFVNQFVPIVEVLTSARCSINFPKNQAAQPHLFLENNLDLVMNSEAAPNQSTIGKKAAPKKAAKKAAKAKK